MPKKNLWTRIYSALADLNYKFDFAEEMELPAAMALDVLMKNIIKQQPHGHQEYDPKGYYAVGTVSERIGHTPIEDGWRTSIEHTENGLKTQIKNVSQHISVVITGTEKKEYSIPSMAPSVFFWWGRPQRWPPLDGRDPGYRRFPLVHPVTHPGQEENPFVARALHGSIPDMKHSVSWGVRGWLRRLMSNHGLRER